MNSTDFFQRMGPTYLPGETHTGVSDWSNCKRCVLHHTRKRVAIIRRGGYGKLRILFIGEAPGQTEDVTGHPFVGLSGRILNFMFTKVREPFTYLITNAVGCRPVDLVMLDANDDKMLRKGLDLSKYVLGDDYELQDFNRQPTRIEIDTCKPHIDELVSTFEPHAIVRLGVTARSYQSKLPTLDLLHPAAIARLECKLLTVLKETHKLELFLEKLAGI